MQWIWIYLGLIPIALLGRYYLARLMVKTLTSFAEKYHGKVDSDWLFGNTKLILPYRGSTLVIIPFLNLRRHSEYPSIQAILQLNEPRFPEMTLVRYSIVLWKGRAYNPIPTGDKEFDHLFVIHSKDQDAVKKVFTAEVKEKLKNKALRKPTFYFDPDRFVMSAHCQYLVRQEYDAFIDTALAILDQAWS